LATKRLYSNVDFPTEIETILGCMINLKLYKFYVHLAQNSGLNLPTNGTAYEQLHSNTQEEKHFDATVN
jgi:ketopantoate reductase